MGIFCTTKDKPIVLYRGDDTDFIGNQSIKITIKTELDISRCSVHFDLLGVKRVVTELDEDKSFVLNFSRDDTKDFPIGETFASLWLVDDANKRRTVADNIKFIITNNAQFAYHDSEQFITLVVEGSVPSVDWQNVENKPTTLAGYGITDAVKTVNGNAPDANGNVNVQVSSIPIATADTLGGVKVGNGLSVTQDGTLSADAPAHDNTKADSAAVADAFDPAQTYSVGVAVMYNGMRYECTTAVETAGPWTGSANWSAIPVEAPLQTLKLTLAAVESVIADKLEQEALAPPYSEGGTYGVGTVVTHGGKFYICEVAVTVPGPWGSSGVWRETDAFSVIYSLLADKADAAVVEALGTRVAASLYAAAVDAEYNSQGTYAVGETCTYNGYWYKANTVISADGEFNAAHWDLLPVASAIAAKQDTLSAAQLANIAAVPNKANAADLRYALVEKTIANDAVTLDDRAVNEVVVPTPASGATEVTLTLNLPAQIQGRLRDLLVRLDLTNIPTTGVDISGISFAGGAGDVFETDGGSMPENEAGAVNLWSFTETTAGTWAVARKTLTTVTQGGGS